MSLLRRSSKVLLKDIKGGLFGEVQGFVFTIEFQKRGLPYIHLLIFLKQAYKIRDAAHVNSIISPEIPDPVAHPMLDETVTKCMTHSPCGAENGHAPAWLTENAASTFTRSFVQKHVSKMVIQSMPDLTTVTPIPTPRVRSLTIITSFLIILFSLQGTIATSTSIYAPPS